MSTMISAAFPKTFYVRWTWWCRAVVQLQTKRTVGKLPTPNWMKKLVGSGEERLSQCSIGATHLLLFLFADFTSPIFE